MFYRKALWRLMMVIIFGILIFVIDDREVASRFWKLLLLLTLAVVKAGYFVWLNIYILRATAGRHFDFLKYLLFFGVSASLIVLSFGIDYFCLYRIEANSFANIPSDTNLLGQAVAFLYFSLATFSTAGFGDIYPQVSAGRVLVGLELVLFLITMVLILSNIHPLRESLSIRKATVEPVVKKKTKHL
ncbi:MAG: hypothetical protein GC192_17500 [Bacteroidetes bacterium]|nr:hypothetical protein [Bacteroidota bacterium]